MQAQRDHGLCTSLKTLNDFCQYTEDTLVNSADGWVKVSIEITPADVPQLRESVTFPFWHVDMNKFLQSEYGNPEYKDHFALEFMMSLDENGQRWVIPG